MAEMFPSSECPSSLAIAQLLEGLLPADSSARLLSHIAECDACGQILRQMTEDKDRVLTESEEQRLEDLVRQEVRPPVPPKRKSVSRPRWFFPAIAAAFLTVVIGSVWTLVRPRSSRGIETQLAQAYTSRRPFAWRLPDAGHSRIRREMGSNDGSFARPTALIEAQAAIARSLARNTPEVLLHKGWAELLDVDDESAVHSLESARRMAPADIRTALFLGIAYAARGESANKTADLARAVDLLTQVLAANKQDPLALFNRALVYQKMSLFPQAIADWRAFLTVEPTGPWADEARTNLVEAERRVSHHRRSLERAAAGPAAFLQAVSRGEPMSLDVYLERPVLAWIEEDSPQARQALTVMARLLESQSRDHWLSDLLRQGESASAGALLRLVEDNRKGNTSAVLARADQVRAEFSRKSLHAAALRVYAEKVYSQYRSFSPAHCRGPLARQTRFLSGKSYPYLEIRVLTDLANCNALSGSLATTRAYLDRAAALARQHRYRYLEFRARALDVSYRLTSGDVFTTWNAVRGLLAGFWDDAISYSRLNQFLNDLATLAERNRLLAASFVFNAAAAEAASLNGNPLMEGVVRSTAAMRAIQANLRHEAQSQLTRAEQLFQHSPPGPDRNTNLDFVRVAQARIHLVQGEGRQAVALLAEVSQRNRNPDWELGHHLHRVTAEAMLAQGSAWEAEQAIEKAIALLQQRLRDVPLAERSGYLETLSADHRMLAASRVAQGNLEGAARAILASRRVLTPPATTAPVPGDTETWLVAAPVGRLLHVWTVDNREVRHRSRINIEDLDELGQTGFALTSQPRSSTGEVLKYCTRLSRMILGGDPLPARTRLLILADADAARLPWGLLVDSTGSYLADRAEIQIVRTLDRRPAVVLTPRDRLTIVADSRQHILRGRRLSALPEIETEVEALRASFPQGRRWTPETPLETLLPPGNGSLVHFAGHGFGSGNSSVLVLNSKPEVLLNASWVRMFDWSGTRLVVLSSCSSGADRANVALDPESLSLSFLDRGTAAVIASSWPSDAEANSRLMRLLYEGLARGKDAAEALRLAKHSLKQDSRFSHPHYWAGYLLYS